MEPPEWLMGRHAQSMEDLVEWTHRLLAEEAGVHNREQRMFFENAGDIRVYEDSADRMVRVLIPLPYFDAADVTTDDVEEAIAMSAPTGVKIKVAVAPPP